jgi:small subunit ribosomal protein S13
MFIFESELPENKSIPIALLSIYGIGLHHSFSICKRLGFSPNLRIKNLTKKQVYKLITAIELSGISISTDLRKSRLLINKKLVDIKSYKGLRKLQGLPIRGQRTHTNAKSSRRHRNK